MKDNNKFTLVFYGNIKSIISFKKSLVGSIVNINFRKDMNGKDLNLKIMSDIDNDMENIMDLLIKKIENIGYRMNIYQKRKGNIPEINIQNTEENIKTYEDKLNTEEENGKVIKELLELYEKAIEYYSAINDKRYIDYNNKIRSILTNEKYSKLINISIILSISSSISLMILKLKILSVKSFLNAIVTIEPTKDFLKEIIDFKVP
jgi:hypothetical protein